MPHRLVLLLVSSFIYRVAQAQIEFSHKHYQPAVSRCFYLSLFFYPLYKVRIFCHHWSVGGLTLTIMERCIVANPAAFPTAAEPDLTRRIFHFENPPERSRVCVARQNKWAPSPKIKTGRFVSLHLKIMIMASIIIIKVQFHWWPNVCTY